MATYSKSSGIASGAWLDKKTIPAGTRVKIITEAVPTEDEYQGKKRTRNIVKLRIDGEHEPKNFDLNKPTVNGLIDAFGEDSKNWMGQTLTVHAEFTVIGGKRYRAVYLVPEGFEVSTDENDYLVIQLAGSHGMVKNPKTAVPLEDHFDDGAPDITDEDSPF